MNILMTIVAPCELDFVNGVLLRRRMAFCAGNRNMSAFEGIRCASMFCHAEFRLLEAVYRVTGLASPTVFSGAELALMRVLVAIRAPLVCKRSRKVQAMVASAALYRSVFPKKRVSGL